jgi:hypothetical protein
LIAVIGTAVGLGVLAAAVLIVTRPHPAPARHGSQASASPGSNPLPPDEYQQALAGLDRELAPLVQGLTTATNYVAASTAVTQLQARVDARATLLEHTTAPAPVAAAHQHLVKALRQLATDVGLVADDAHRELVCTGRIALVDIARTGGGDLLRAATKELETADPAHAYRTGTFLPAATGPGEDHRLDNGTLIKKPSGRGANELTLKNIGTEDAVVVLAPQGSKTATAIVYVRSASSYTVTGIPNGIYVGWVISGKDWDDKAGIFGRTCNYDPVSGTLPMTSGSGSYNGGSLEFGPSTSPFFADGTDPDTIPH